jgi:Ca2+:H+ antiporter
MAAQTRSALLSWTVLMPAVAVVCVPLTWGRDLGPALVAVMAALLAGAVLAAVHHAEVVAHRVGEPFGSLVLAVAVTLIEVGLIVTLMVAGGPDTASLARWPRSSRSRRSRWCSRRSPPASPDRSSRPRSWPSQR